MHVKINVQHTSKSYYCIPVDPATRAGHRPQGQESVVPLLRYQAAPTPAHRAWVSPVLRYLDNWMLPC